MIKKIIRILICTLLILSTIMIKTDINPHNLNLKAYEPDKYPPKITYIYTNPNLVGFGFNISVNSTVFDNLSGVKLVAINITYPDGSYSNYTMNKTQGNNYLYNFSDTWKTGWYNYTIWAVDNANNSNISSKNSFNVSATANVNIATLKDSYTDNEYVNITDPPTLPVGYSVIGRGLTWNEYYDSKTGSNILESYTTPVNYQDATNNWVPINNTINQLKPTHQAYSYGYRIGNEKGLYNVYFKPDINDSWPFVFAYNKSENPTTYVVRSKLVGVGYLDPSNDWSYKILQQVQSSPGQVNDNKITYNNTFTGADVSWAYGNTELKEEITMSNTTKNLLQSHPPSEYKLNNDSSYLVFITKLDYQNLNLYNNSDQIIDNITIYANGINFKDALGYIKSALPLGYAYELYNESNSQKLIYRIIRLKGETYLLSGVKVSSLNTMTFPVVVDPSLTVGSLTTDGYIYKSSSNYNTAWTSSTGTVSDTASYISIGQSKVVTIPPDYRIYRGFLPFNTSQLPTNAYIDNATLSLYKKDDYSTTDFFLTVQNGQPTYPHTPLQAGDYSKSHYSGYGGSLNTRYFINGRNNILLTNDSWITKGGITKLCLRSDRDINGTAPTTSEYINIYSADASSPGVNIAPRLIIYYRNQSKIQNTGSTDIKGYLQMQVQYYFDQFSQWLVVDNTIDESTPRIIRAGDHLALDTIFNGLVNSSSLPCNGTYRVYVAFRDSSGNILKCNNNVHMSAFHLFTYCHHVYIKGWRKLFADGFGKNTNLATRGTAIYNNELYVGTENHNKSKLHLFGNGFSGSTQITMADGSYKSIQNIQVGDNVKVYNFDNHSYVSAEVLAVQNPSEGSTGYTIKINNKLNASSTQVICVNGTLKEAQDVKLGDYLINETGSYVTASSLVNVSNRGSMYDFIIGLPSYNNLTQEPNDLCFFAEGLQVYSGGTDGTNGFGGEADLNCFNLIPYFNLGVTDLCSGGLNLIAASSDGCEIWKYNYTTDHCTQIIGDHGTMMKSGFNDSYNWAAGAMAVFNNKLYVGTWNSPYRNGSQIWRYDGAKWEKVVPYGFGDLNNTAIASMAVFNNYLYAGTINFNWTDNGFCQVWRTADGENWTKVVDKGFRDCGANVDVKNAYAWSMTVFQNRLYIGTFNVPVNTHGWWDFSHRGCQLWNSSTGNRNDWHCMDLNGSKYGFGETVNYGIRNLVNWSDQYLYVGVTASYLQLQCPGYRVQALEIWNYTGSSSSPWKCMAGENATNDPNSWSYDGFGNTWNKYPWSMTRCGNKLWVGTDNSQELGQPHPSEGCEVWRLNGNNWTPIVKNGYEKGNGFGQWYSHGARSMIEFPKNSGNLVVGTFTQEYPGYDSKDPEPGCQIWMRNT